MVNQPILLREPETYSRHRLCKVSPISSTTSKRANTIHIKESHSAKVTPESINGQSTQIRATSTMVYQLRVSRTPRISFTQWEAAIRKIGQSPICTEKRMVISCQENKNKEDMTGNLIQTSTDSATLRKRS